MLKFDISFNTKLVILIYELSPVKNTNSKQEDIWKRFQFHSMQILTAVSQQGFLVLLLVKEPFVHKSVLSCSCEKQDEVKRK